MLSPMSRLRPSLQRGDAPYDPAARILSPFTPRHSTRAGDATVYIRWVGEHTMRVLAPSPVVNREISPAVVATRPRNIDLSAMEVWSKLNACLRRCDRIMCTGPHRLSPTSLPPTQGRSKPQSTLASYHFRHSTFTQHCLSHRLPLAPSVSLSSTSLRAPTNPPRSPISYCLLDHPATRWRCCLDPQRLVASWVRDNR